MIQILLTRTTYRQISEVVKGTVPKIAKFERLFNSKILCSHKKLCIVFLILFNESVSLFTKWNFFLILWCEFEVFKLNVEARLYTHWKRFAFGCCHFFFNQRWSLLYIHAKQGWSSTSVFLTTFQPTIFRGLVSWVSTNYFKHTWKSVLIVNFILTLH